MVQKKSRGHDNSHEIQIERWVMILKFKLFIIEGVVGMVGMVGMGG